MALMAEIYPLQLLIASLAGLADRNSKRPCAYRKCRPGPQSRVSAASEGILPRRGLHVEARRADHPGMPDLSLIWSIVELALKDRAQLALENAALRHQLGGMTRCCVPE